MNNLRLDCEKVTIFLVPVVFFTVFLGIKIADREKYGLLIKEDSSLEYTQAACYFLASVVSLIVFLRFFKNKQVLLGSLYGVLAVGLVFIALEEVSWGQRMFGVAVPDYLVQSSTQREINIHNLEAVQPWVPLVFIAMGFYGAFAWLFVRLLDLREKFGEIVDFVVPDWFISSYFFFVFFVFLLLEYLVPIGIALGVEELRINYFLRWRDQEPAEFLLSLGFLCFAVINNARSQMYLRNGNLVASR